MMEKKTLLSAIIISYNGMRFLPDCLRTLTGDLSGLSHELVVVDNASTDGSAEFVSETYPGTKLIVNDANLGFARAFNLGVEASHGRYVCVCNQDLRFRPRCLTALLERLEEEPSLGLIGPAYYGFDGRLMPSARAFPRYRDILYYALLLDRVFPEHREFAAWKMGWFDHRSERYVDQPMGAVMMFPREVFDRVGLMDESFPVFGNDVDLCRRLDTTGLKRLYYPPAAVEHYVGGSTVRRPYRSIVESHRGLYRYFRKYAPRRAYPLLWLTGLLLLVGLIPRLGARAFSRPELAPTQD
jgi:GT2 family glycosyltransferase